MMFWNPAFEFHAEIAVICKRIIETRARSWRLDWHYCNNFGAVGPNTEDSPFVLRPELSVRQAAKPLVIKAGDDLQEIQFVSRYVSERQSLNPDAPICIV